MERESDKRRQVLDGLKYQVQKHSQDLQDNDWIERVVVNPDVTKLFEHIVAEMEEQKGASLRQLEEKLLEAPMTSDETMRCKQMVSIMRTEMKVAREIAAYPEREVDRLKQVRSWLVDAQSKIKELERGEVAHA